MLAVFAAVLSLAGLGLILVGAHLGNRTLSAVGFGFIAAGFAMAFWLTQERRRPMG